MSRRWLTAFSLLLILCSVTAQADNSLVRLAVVNTPYQSGLLQTLISDFEARSGYRVSLYSGNDVFEQARQGEADLLIAHYGKSPMQTFVLSGLGSWPQLVFANQQVIIGPKSDPAGIRGMKNASLALQRIAEQQQPFVLNQIKGVKDLFELLWLKAGKPDKQGWLIDEAVAKGQAMKQADKRQAYTLWGATPFLRFSQQHQPDLEILVSADPLLQRVMAISLVNADKVRGINKAGAEMLRDYLLSTPVQARISAYRQRGYKAQLWWPAARHN